MRHVGRVAMVHSSVGAAHYGSLRKAVRLPGHANDITDGTLAIYRATMEITSVTLAVGRIRRTIRVAMTVTEIFGPGIKRANLEGRQPPSFHQ